MLCASVIGCTHIVLQANPGSRLASAFTEIVAYMHRSAARVLPDSIDPDEGGWGYVYEASQAEVEPGC